MNDARIWASCSENFHLVCRSRTLTLNFTDQQNCNNVWHTCSCVPVAVSIMFIEYKRILVVYCGHFFLIRHITSLIFSLSETVFEWTTGLGERDFWENKIDKPNFRRMLLDHWCELESNDAAMDYVLRIQGMQVALALSVPHSRFCLLKAPLTSCIWNSSLSI